jgi:hypothetical protein
MAKLDSLPNWLHKTMVYFGLADPRPEPGVRWIGAQRSLLGTGIAALTLAMVSGIVVVDVFHWKTLDVLAGAALGAVVWGSLGFFTVVRHEIPRAASLPAAPDDAEVEPAFRLHASVLLALPLTFGLAWLADRWNLGAMLVPGQLAGVAAVNLLGAALVARWQRTHGGRVLSRHSGAGEPELYAAS